MAFWKRAEKAAPQPEVIQTDRRLVTGLHRYRVEGFDRFSSCRTSLIVEARSENEARRAVNNLGIRDPQVRIVAEAKVEAATPPKADPPPEPELAGPQREADLGPGEDEPGGDR